MPFPRTKKKLRKFFDDEASMNMFCIILQLYDLNLLQPPRSKQQIESDGYYAQQSPEAIDAIKKLFPHNNADVQNHDQIIHVEIIKCGHILNLLSELNDKELEKSFIEEMAKKLGRSTEETKWLLQQFHVFTKTPTTSKAQEFVINNLFFHFEEIFQDNASYHKELCIAIKGRPYLLGPVDGAVLIRNGQGCKLIIIEYDGRKKSEEEIEKRNRRLLNMMDSEESIIIDINSDEIMITGVELFCGKDEKSIKDQFKKSGFLRRAQDLADLRHPQCHKKPAPAGSNRAYEVRHPYRDLHPCRDLHRYQ